MKLLNPSRYWENNNPPPGEMGKNTRIFYDRTYLRKVVIILVTEMGDFDFKLRACQLQDFYFF
jgi:hypothetical protein